MIFLATTLFVARLLGRRRSLSARAVRLTLGAFQKPRILPKDGGALIVMDCKVKVGI